MKRIRKVLFWSHLVAGSIGGLIIFTMCVTGVLLAFEKQIVKFVERDLRFVNSTDEIERLSLSEIVTQVRRQNPAIKLDVISIRSEPDSTILIGRDPVFYVDAYTGSLLGTGSGRLRNFFRSITEFHRWLGSKTKDHQPARAITGACNLAFFFLAVSGLFLWLPGKSLGRPSRPMFWFQRKVKGHARNFNWHNVIGFWCAPVLIVLTLTGVVMSYPWANDLLFTLAGSPKPPRPPVNRNAGGASKNPLQVPANIDAVWSRAQQQIPGWETINIRLAAKPNAPITFSIEANQSMNPFARSELVLDPKSLEIEKWESYETASTGRKLRTWARGLHTGEALRSPGQLIALIATTGGAFLVWTGISLALRRLRKRLKQSNSANKPVNLQKV